MSLAAPPQWLERFPAALSNGEDRGCALSIIVEESPKGKGLSLSGQLAALCRFFQQRFSLHFIFPFCLAPVAGSSRWRRRGREGLA